MKWQDEGYLLSKNNFDENSIIIETFTKNHGKYAGIVYGGSSRKQKKNFQTGNKIFLNWTSKNENRSGYFNVELIDPISPFFFDDKKKIVCILSATSILKILLPERQINKEIYNSFEKMLLDLKLDNWISLYINWELLLIKELGFEDNLKIDDGKDIKKSLNFNKTLLMENFIIPNRLKFPLYRNILESYFI
jgi:DNA repair protein RecO (recombination protein O)